MPALASLRSRLSAAQLRPPAPDRRYGPCCTCPMTAFFRLCPPWLARLHELISQTVFTSHGPPEPRLNWANESDPPAQPSQPFLGLDDPPATPPRPGSAQQLSDPVRVYIEHDVDEGTYEWQDVNPPLSARRGRKGPWTSQEGWVARHSADPSPSGVVAVSGDVRTLSGRDTNLDPAPGAGRWSEASDRPRVLHLCLSVCPSDTQLLRPLPPPGACRRAHWPW